LGRPSPQDQPERLADLGVELVPAPELGQRRARDVFQPETSLLGSSHYLTPCGGTSADGLGTWSV